MSERLKPGTSEFFEKYKFQMSSSQPHPIYKDTMHFEGLEAEYVGRIERDLDHYKKMCSELIMRNENYAAREQYRLRDELEKEKRK